MKEAVTTNTYIIRHATAEDIQRMLEVFNYYSELPLPA